jgi:AbrB family looped-hinge helix DNA binding protein
MRQEAKITSKGQITLPAALRAKWGLRDGDKVEFHTDTLGNVVVRPRNAKPSAVFEQFGDRVMKSHVGSDDDAIAAAILEKDSRSRKPTG